MPVPAFPGAVMGQPWFWCLDDTFQPLAGAKLYTYDAGTLNPRPVYSDPGLTTPHANPVVANGFGFTTIWLGAFAYKFRLYTAADVFVREIDGVEDLGQIFINQLGLVLGQGSRDVEEGYTVVAADRLITINSSTSTATPCPIYLESLTTRKMPITLVNKGIKDVAVTPQSGESIQGVAGPFTLPAAAYPLLPVVTLVPTVDGYWPIGGIGIGSAGGGGGGSGSSIPSVVQGDLLYGAAASTLAALAKNTTASRYLSNQGTANNPSWAQVNLANGVVNSLPPAHLAGGAGASATTFFCGDNSWKAPTVATASPLTGNGVGSPVGVASGFQIMRVAEVTLTDAQVKALPTTPITIVAAPGAGFKIELHHAYLLASFAAGGYTNVNTTLSYLVLSTNGVVSSYIANDSAATPALAHLTTFMDNTKKAQALVPWQDVGDLAQAWGLVAYVSTGFVGDNQPLQLVGNNNGSGDFTGGNAANTLRVRVYYTIEATT